MGGKSADLPFYCLHIRQLSFLKMGLKMYSVIKELTIYNSLTTSCKFWRLPIKKIFANILDPDQARRNVGPDLDPKCLTI